MKIFTATFYQNNYGSVLQAYALQQKLKELGGEPVIISASKQSFSRNKDIWQKVFNLLKPEKHYGPIRKIRRALQKRMYTQKGIKINEFIAANLEVKSFEECIKEMDKQNSILLAGSDQIWSIINHQISDTYLFNYPEYKGMRKYSYAASIGVSDLTDEQILYYKKALSSFDSVSFREKAAYNLLKDKLDNPIIRQDIDPTLLYSSAFWKKLAIKRSNDHPYLFIYMLRPDKKVIRIARKIAKEKHLDIIYMGLYVNYYRGIKTVSDGGVEDFLSYIKHAEIVITNSFHGTAFSILFEKKFVSVKLASTSSRVENLLEIVGLSDHLITDISNSEIAELTYDGERVRTRLEAKRIESIQYLKEIIELQK
nr:polysaccharide pyruvyl transferase family protein [uncultured Sellimonas sp.]